MQTREWLGPITERLRCQLELEDVQPLFGGVRWTLTGTHLRVQHVLRGGQAQPWQEYVLAPVTLYSLLDQLQELDFLTLASSTRPGVPDEACPALTVINPAGEQRRVARWIGDRDVRFSILYARWRALAVRNTTSGEVR